MAAFGVLSGELIKLTSRQTSASSNYCLLQALYLNLLVSCFGPTLATSLKSPPSWELWVKVPGIHTPAGVWAEDALRALQGCNRAA